MKKHVEKRMTQQRGVTRIVENVITQHLLMQMQTAFNSIVTAEQY